MTDQSCSPPSGDGANVALFDSLQLAQQIKKHGLDGLDRAVEEYEKGMFPRAIELVGESMKVNEKIFAHDAAKNFKTWFQEMFANGQEA